MYLKLMIDGTTSIPFSAETVLLAQPKQSFRKAVIDESRKKYNRSRESIEAEIETRYCNTPKDNFKTGTLLNRKGGVETLACF